MDYLHAAKVLIDLRNKYKDEVADEDEITEAYDTAILLLTTTRKTNEHV